MSIFFEEEFSEFETEKQNLINNLNYLKSLDVYEFTFYKKYQEINSDFFSKYKHKSIVVKNKIWKPTDIFDSYKTIKEIENLNPKIKHVETSSDEELWTILRTCCHSMTYETTPGRFLKFLIYDENTQKYLGVTSISSDVISITCRDEYIGWTKENKLEDKRLANSAIGSCIMSTQPFGYNFLGGKLIACITISKTVRDIWEKLYNDVLVGFTTTSLYGTQSMYNNIPYWKKCGSSSGKITIKPDDKYYNYWHNYIKKNNSDYIEAMTQKDGVSGPVTGAKLKVLSMIFSELKLKKNDYDHGFERGVYYSCIYTNTKEFLKNQINKNDLILNKMFDRDIDDMLKWWKPKAIDRYMKLHKENRLKPNSLFYNDLLNYSYEDSKKIYLNDVGR